jgi:HSP20 family protein
MTDDTKRPDDDRSGDDSTSERGRPSSPLGGLFQGLADLADRLGDLAEQGQDTVRRFEMPGGGEAVFGLRVRTMREEGGRTRVDAEPFGHVRRTDEDTGAVTVEEVREPVVDVFDEAETASRVLVVAEMPGISAADVTLDATGDVLTLTAEAGTRRYRKELLLPHAVDADAADVRANNGLVEVRLPVAPQG